MTDLQQEDDDLYGTDLDQEVDDDDGGGGPGQGARAAAVLDYVARSIVDDADAVVVETQSDRRGVVLRLHVAPDDMGKVIGRRGRVAQAIRTLVRATAAGEGVEATVDIVD